MSETKALEMMKDDSNPEKKEEEDLEDDDGEDEEFMTQKKQKGKIMTIISIFIMVMVNVVVVFKLREDKRLKANRFTKTLKKVFEEGDEQTESDYNQALSLKETVEQFQMVIEKMQKLGNLTFFDLNSQGSEFKIEKTAFNGSFTEENIKNLKSFPFDLDKPSTFKSYVAKSETKKMTFSMSNIMMSERITTGEVICYDLTMQYELTFFGLKFSRFEYEPEATKCNPADVISKIGPNVVLFSYNTRAAIIYIFQVVCGLIFFYRGFSVFIDLTALLKSIKLNALGKIQTKLKLDIDFNLYRYMMTTESLTDAISDNMIKNYSSIIISVKMLRPFYYICMVGYFVQICCGSNNLYCLLHADEVSQNQLTLSGISVFLSWMDAYTLTSLSKGTGILSTAFLAIVKKVVYFSVGVIVVLLAFAMLGLSMYQKTAPFGTLARSIITIWGFSNGDAIREQTMKFQNEPFALLYMTGIILVFYSSLAQIYVVLFISQFESHLEEQEEQAQKKIESQEKFKKKQVKRGKTNQLAILQDPTSHPDGSEDRLKAENLEKELLEAIDKMNTTQAKKDLLKSTFSWKSGGAEASKITQQDPTFDFYDNILKSLSVELLGRLMSLRDFVKDYSTQNREDEGGKKAFSIYQENLRLFILKIEHMRRGN